MEEYLGLGAAVTLVTEDRFFATGEMPDGAVIVDAGNAQGDGLLIERIRKTKEMCLVPVFTVRELPRFFDPLHDGRFTNYGETAARARDINGRIAQMKGEAGMDNPEYRVLAYLFTRDAALVPIETPLSPQIYVYPLVEVMGEEKASPFKWMTRLLDRGVITPADLLDRIRLCPKCEWSHHNFVDICPVCRSINISKVPFIHCFTCGHVAPQEQFLTQGIMMCPSCRTKLRHIGSDYDRPMENYFCPDCNQSFIEPLIIAHCANCGQKNNPDELITWPIYSYKLTAKGRSSAKVGGIDDIFALLDSMNYVNPNFFITILEWMIRLANRYPEDPFSVIGIGLRNTEELTERMGRHETSTLVDSFAERLRQLIRSTDITTRMTENTLWILLPKTPSPGCAVLSGKISDLRILTRQPDGLTLDLKTVSLTIPEGMLKGETAELLLARLATSMED